MRPDAQNQTEAGAEGASGHRRRIAAGAVAVAAVAAVGIAVSATGGSQESVAGQTAGQRLATTKIVRQDLDERETVDGTLGYSDARAVINRLEGTVTWTPPLGSVVDTNHTLYEVDGEAVYLLNGAYPAYRTLQSGTSGDDVLALERNLRALDLDTENDMSVDGVWDYGTTAAVQRWQDRKGLAQTGSIEKGRIVFQPGARRVGDIAVGVGESASGGSGGSTDAAGSAGGSASAGASSTLMTTTSNKRIVAVDLEATKQALATRGGETSVELPGGKEVEGTIASVSKVAQKKATSADEDPPATIKVVIKLKDSTGTGLDQAPVDVSFQKTQVKDVLTVPVTALIARQGGSFAVEVRDGTSRQLVEVQTGLYTDSFVEIEGDGLTAGMAVTDARV